MWSPLWRAQTHLAVAADLCDYTWTLPTMCQVVDMSMVCHTLGPRGTRCPSTLRSHGPEAPTVPHTSPPLCTPHCVPPRRRPPPGLVTQRLTQRLTQRPGTQRPCGAGPNGRPGGPNVKSTPPNAQKFFLPHPPLCRRTAARGSTVAATGNGTRLRAVCARGPARGRGPPVPPPVHVAGGRDGTQRPVTQRLSTQRPGEGLPDLCRDCAKLCASGPRS